MPSVPSCASFWKAQPRLGSGLGYLRLHCFAARTQAAGVGKVNDLALPVLWQAGAWDPFKGSYSLSTFEGFVSVFPTDPCTSGLFCVFFPEKICMWDRNGIAFPHESSQLTAELCLPCVIGTVRLFPQGGRIYCLHPS